MKLKRQKMGFGDSYVHVTDLQDSFGEGSHTLYIYIVLHGSKEKPNKHFSLKLRTANY